MAGERTMRVWKLQSRWKPDLAACKAELQGDSNGSSLQQLAGCPRCFGKPGCRACFSHSRLSVLSWSYSLDSQKLISNSVHHHPWRTCGHLQLSISKMELTFLWKLTPPPTPAGKWPINMHGVAQVEYQELSLIAPSPLPRITPLPRWLWEGRGWPLNTQCVSIRSMTSSS